MNTFEKYMMPSKVVLEEEFEEESEDEYYEEDLEESGVFYDFTYNREDDVIEIGIDDALSPSEARDLAADLLRFVDKVERNNGK